MNASLPSGGACVAVPFAQWTTDTAATPRSRCGVGRHTKPGDFHRHDLRRLLEARGPTY